MSFDIATASNIENYDAGSFMAFVDPATGDKLTDDTGNVLGVTLRSRLSRAALRHQREVGAKRLEMGRRGQEVGIEQLESEATEMLAACTAAWTFDILDGIPFPCTLENARKFWADERFRAHRERANVWVNNEANFTKR